jgi:hypothetical protein
LLIGIEHLLSGYEVASLGQEEQAAVAEENTRKLYMAMTRAGQHLILLSAQKIPRFIEDSFTQIASTCGAASAVGCLRGALTQGGVTDAEMLPP